MKRTKKGRKERIRKEKIGKWTIRWRVDKFGRCNLSARSMRTSIRLDGDNST